MNRKPTELDNLNQRSEMGDENLSLEQQSQIISQFRQ